MELYNYQQKAVDTTDEHKKGILVLPTGTGKTMIQSAIIERDIINNPNQFRMYTILAPRIILTYQLLKEVYSFLISKNIEVRYHFTHSGSPLDIKDLEELRIESEIPFSQIGSTTSSKELTEIIKKTQDINIPLIVFSTYNSADRVEEARSHCNNVELSIMLNDEAHYLVQDRFYDIVDKLQSDRKYFFTATMRVNVSDEGRGMNNVSTYGEVIYKLLPREAIEMGKMVRPRIHFVTTEGVRTEEDLDVSINKVLHNAFKTQIDYFLEHNPNIVPKIIVSTRGSHDIKNFLGSEEYFELRGNGVEIFSISSNEEIGNDINMEKVNRQEFLKRIKEAGKDVNKRMLVLHYDILTEGIDVPGLTSCLPLRNLNKSRFVQTLGRCSRLDSRDRQMLDNGEISWLDIDKMNKPYAFVILPNITLTNNDDMEQMRAFVFELRDFGFRPEEDIVGDVDALGIDDDNDLDTFSKPNRRNNQQGNLIETILNLFEEEYIANLSEIEMLRHFANN